MVRRNGTLFIIVKFTLNIGYLDPLGYVVCFVVLPSQYEYHQNIDHCGKTRSSVPRVYKYPSIEILGPKYYTCNGLRDQPGDSYVVPFWL